MANRVGVVSRKTNETDIQMELNLDGSGYAKVDTGIGFFDHMLISFAKHGFFDLNCKVTGDLFVDSHHTIEDTGIVLGQAIAKAVGDKQGIKRFGSFMLPMDETLVLSALDLSGRPYLVYDLDLSTPQVGYFDTQMVKEFFYAVSYAAAMNLHFEEFHGDRHVDDDGATVGGIAYLDECPITVIGQQKGRTTKENITRNFGMPSPEGYRKALRLMKQAEKFHRPIINFIDTPGAFPGLEAEEHGQGEAIARNLYEMAALKVPVLSIVIGEGGSGGALALAVGNKVWMMENATYTILSPEGFASILWKDSRKAPEAAEVMKVTAAHLKELGIIERIIPEEYPASEENLPEIAEYMKIRMKQFLEKQTGKSGLQIAQERYERFRKM